MILLRGEEDHVGEPAEALNLAELIEGGRLHMGGVCQGELLQTL
jgi:hypothetical protein